MLLKSVPWRKDTADTQTRMVVGVGFLLLALLSSIIASSFWSQYHTAHAAKPATNTTTGVSKTWYFADGRVGGGFREYLTISNPDPTTDCSATLSYLPEGELSAAQAKGHPTARKPLDVRTVNIPHASRYTASVNQDLSVDQAQQPGLLLSAEVSVPFNASCAGVVVERPMYFNTHGVNSGSNVMGTTSLGESFYFADVPSLAGASSYMHSTFSVLNPSLTDTATINVNYYAKGNQVSGQILYIAPGARGLIDPGTLAYPHVAAIVTSSSMVAVERFSYMHNVQAEVAGTVSSASSVVGAQLLSNDWLFAEGYTGGQTQENLLLSNLTNADTTATVTLEYQNTHHQTLTVLVPAYSQVPVDVNSANTQPTGTCDVIPCVTTPEVSAEVTATSASLVVERQMFFHYAHTVPGTSISTTTIGGTEVQGTLNPATTAANFAEGYTNVGYNEWLTLQNPMATDETLAVSINNEYGRAYTQNVLVKAKNRSTVDVTALVLQHLVQHGDDYRGYQVSMHVQTTTAGTVFVAERPMYFSLSANIQGGTDVVGFTGSYSCTEFQTSLNGAYDNRFMATGPDGNIWLAENYNNKIGKVTPFGVATEYTLPTANSGVEGMANGPDGNMWFVEQSNNKIGKITTAGVITEYALPTANSYPYSIVAGADGNLWFGERENGGMIGKITPTGTITEYSVASATSNILSVTLGPDGNVWFALGGASKVGFITPAGTVTEFSAGITAGSTINDITPGPDGNLWFTEDQGRIGRITPAGVVTEFSQGITSGSEPHTIRQGADGNLWFTEYDGNKIGIITTTGSASELPITNINYSTVAMALGSDNNIWFSDYGSTDHIGRCAISS